MRKFRVIRSSQVYQESTNARTGSNSKIYLFKCMCLSKSKCATMVTAAYQLFLINIGILECMQYEVSFPHRQYNGRPMYPWDNRLSISLESWEKVKFVFTQWESPIYSQGLYFLTLVKKYASRITLSTCYSFLIIWIYLAPAVRHFIAY